MKKKTVKPFETDKAFYVLADEVTKAIAHAKDGSEQKQQVEELLQAEKDFKNLILTYKQSTAIYKKFLQKVKIRNGNILSARPYFREASKNFSKNITPCIKANDIEKLKTFDINFHLVKFIKESWLGPFPKKAEFLYQRVFNAREKLIVLNMPLAINRAKLFYRKTPKSHLSLMDMIGICAAGLLAGIDKYVGPYTTVFRSVAIGRMVGNLIADYSETMLHFYPTDRRILYKANAIRGRQGIDDIDELTEAVNKAFKDDEKEGITGIKQEIDVSYLHHLMQASSPISAEQTMHTDDDSVHNIYDSTADDTKDIETAYIEKEMMGRMLHSISRLPIIHRKILKLKGIKIA